MRPGRWEACWAQHAALWVAVAGQCAGAGAAAGPGRARGIRQRHQLIPSASRRPSRHALCALTSRVGMSEQGACQVGVAQAGGGVHEHLAHAVLLAPAGVVIHWHARCGRGDERWGALPEREACRQACRQAGSNRRLQQLAGRVPRCMLPPQPPARMRCCPPRR